MQPIRTHALCGRLFGRGIRLHRISCSSRERRWGCPRSSFSETPSRKRCGSLHRPCGPQTNRQFLPVVLDHGWAVKRLNSGGCRPVIGFIPALKSGAFSSNVPNSSGSVEPLRSGSGGSRYDQRSGRNRIEKRLPPIPFVSGGTAIRRVGWGKGWDGGERMKPEGTAGN